MAEKKSDRRARQRFPVHVPVSLKADRGGLPESTQTRDLSTAGVFVYTNSRMQEGSELELILVLPPEITFSDRRWVCCQASVVRVYLASSASPDAVTALTGKLSADPRVASVKYISADQALAEARSRPGLDNLASLSSTNPFPASLDVKVKLVTQVAAVASSVKGDPAVDPSYPTSYDPDTYSRLRHFALIAGGIAAGVVLLLAIVAYAVVANSMRGIAASRRQETGLTRLLGARGWMVRGPFVVEGLTTGALAGALAAAVVAGVWLLAVRFESAVYTQVLPGVDATSVQYLTAALIVAGFVLGTATALLSFRKASHRG